mmetsp:Transcript_55969/g.111088  ORF Transcript_55969/g.111088 Transcript_55969/m.111088 type:complete len:93 (-) Transcript_55969:435-713(-)
MAEEFHDLEALFDALDNDGWMSNPADAVRLALKKAGKRAGDHEVQNLFDKQSFSEFKAAFDATPQDLSAAMIRQVMDCLLLPVRRFITSQQS